MPARPESADVRPAWRARGLLLAITFVSAALASRCATSRFVFPTTLPTPYADAAAAWREASRGCQDVNAYGAELRVAGRLEGRRLPSLTLGLAIERDGRMAIDARYSGASVFVLRGSARESTLVLTDERRVVTAAPDVILDALVGVPLGPTRLLAVLTGCVSAGGEPTRGEQVGGLLRLAWPDATVYLARVGGQWRVRAGTFERFSVDYGVGPDTRPHRIALRTEDGRSPSVDLSLTVVASDGNRRDPSVFVPVVPTGAEALSIEALREGGPIGSRP